MKGKPCRPKWKPAIRWTKTTLHSLVPFLISTDFTLDEATSAFDAVTEASIAMSLKRLSRNRTTIVVAHKLSSIEDADVIFVMDEGNLLSLAPTQLMKKKKLYAKMVKTQKTKID